MDGIKIITPTMDNEVPNTGTAKEVKEVEKEYKIGESMTFESKKAIGAYIDKLIEKANN